MAQQIRPEELFTRFTHHPPHDDQPVKFNRLRTKGRDLADLINDLCPESREKALAFENLEQAIMWANAAISRRE